MVMIGDRVEHAENVLVVWSRQLFPFQSILQRITTIQTYKRRVCILKQQLI